MINLLLEDLKVEIIKRQREILIARWLTLTLTILIVFFLGSYIVLSFVENNYKSRLAKIVGSRQEAKQAVEKINKLNTLLELNLKKEEIYTSLSSRNIIWHRKLLQLQEILPKEMWIKELALPDTSAKQHILKLKGGLINLSGRNLTSFLGEFTNNIKHTDFFQGFNEVLLSQVNRVTRRDTEIMEFDMEFKFTEQ